MGVWGEFSTWRDVNAAAIVSVWPSASHAVWWVLRHKLTAWGGLDVEIWSSGRDRRWFYVGSGAVGALADEAREGAHEMLGARDCDRQAIAQWRARERRAFWERCGRDR